MRPDRLPLYAAALLLLVLALVFYMGPAGAHSWYDHQCCADNDCAPIISQQDHPDGWLVTTKHGTVVVPISMPKGEEWREKENKHDGLTHVCMRRTWTSDADQQSKMPMRFLCIYRPALN